MAYATGDSNLPEWKTKILEMKNKDINTSKKFNEQFVYGASEVGLRNPNTKSHMKIFDNGDIEIFDGNKTGMKISDVHNTVNIYGDGINTFSNRLNLRTQPYGLSWNGYILNPQFYQLLDQDLLIDASVRYWVEATEDYPAHWARRSIAIKPFSKMPYDSTYNSLLQQLGIPI